MKLICFGDSLTFGSIGYSYIRYLRSTTNLTLKNKGVNGDTTFRMFSRLKHFTKHLDYQNPDTYIICIGCNDLLLPYLTSVSISWRTQMKPRVAVMHCLTDIQSFEYQYRQMIDHIHSLHQNI